MLVSSSRIIKTLPWTHDISLLLVKLMSSEKYRTFIYSFIFYQMTQQMVGGGLCVGVSFSIINWVSCVSFAESIWPLRCHLSKTWMKWCHIVKNRVTKHLFYAQTVLTLTSAVSKAHCGKIMQSFDHIMTPGLNSSWLVSLQKVSCHDSAFCNKSLPFRWVMSEAFQYTERGI